MMNFYIYPLSSFGVSTILPCYLSSLLTWTADNDMQVNTSKTKETILGRIDSTSIPPLSTPAGPIQRVTTVKLIGLHLDAGLSWTTHINTIISKASKRLYFLKQLRTAGVPPQQLLHFCTAVIRQLSSMPLRSGTIPSPKLSLNT